MLLGYRWGRSSSNVVLRFYPLVLPEIYHVLPVLVVKRRRGVYQCSRVIQFR